MESSLKTKPILTITGSDSTCLSGVQADLKTISQLGGYAVTAITSVTVQTTLGIQEFFDLPAGIVRGQVEAVMNDVAPRVVKIGLVRTRETLDVIVDLLQRYRPEHVIYAPVFRSARGEVLVGKELVADISDRLLPLCSLVVKPEADATHGQANRYASALAFYLNNGYSEAEADAAAHKFVRVSSGQTSLQGRGGELYREFLTRVAHHWRTNSDVSFYAEALNVSMRYLAQVTRRAANQTPKAIIEEHVACEAESALRSTDSTVQEVARALGFSSQAHFSKFFRKVRGLSPSEFRKQSIVHSP